MGDRTLIYNDSTVPEDGHDALEKMAKQNKKGDGEEPVIQDSYAHDEEV